jgi:hypothetical protein
MAAEVNADRSSARPRSRTRSGAAINIDPRHGPSRPPQAASTLGGAAPRTVEARGPPSMTGRARGTIHRAEWGYRRSSAS